MGSVPSHSRCLLETKTRTQGGFRTAMINKEGERETKRQIEIKRVHQLYTIRNTPSGCNG